MSQFQAKFYKRRFLSDFTKNTGLHGVSFFDRKKYILSLWVLTCASFGLWECQTTLTSYLEFNVKTKVVRQEADGGVIPFPAITFCSSNSFVRNVAGGTKTVLIDSYTSVTGMSLKDALQWLGTCFNSSIPSIVTDKTGIFNRPGGFPSLMRKSQIDSEKSILNCSHSGRIFDCSRQFLNKGTDAGFCFTFNGAASITNAYPLEGKPCPGSLLIDGVIYDNNDNGVCGLGNVRAYGTTPEEKMIFDSNFSGPLSGIRFQLLTNESEYCTSTLFGQSGFIAVVHDTDAEPILMTKRYLMLSPGYSHNIGMTVRKTVRLTENLGYCKSRMFLKYYNETVAYTSKDKFIVNCLTERIIARCKCVPYYAPPKTALLTFNKQQVCSYPTSECQIREERSELTVAGNCFQQMPTPCEEVHIDTQMTSSLYGSQNNLAWFKRLYKNATKMTLAQFRRNYLSANFYMRSSTSELVTEKVAMTWVDLMNSLGGAIGMAIGMSLITIVELLSLAILKPIAKFNQFRDSIKERQNKRTKEYRNATENFSPSRKIIMT